jgi:hypothetical protein
VPITLNLMCSFDLAQFDGGYSHPLWFARSHTFAAQQRLSTPCGGDAFKATAVVELSPRRSILSRRPSHCCDRAQTALSKRSAYFAFLSLALVDWRSLKKVR